MRVWLKNQLTLPDTPLFEQIGERVFPRESLNSSRIEFPYLIFGLGNSTDEELSESYDDFEFIPERQFFQVWVHDELTAKGGSFLRIDNQVIPQVKRQLLGKGSPEDGVIQVRYLETSGEFSNEALKSVFRYIRFQAILGKVKQP